MWRLTHRTKCLWFHQMVGYWLRKSASHLLRLRRGNRTSQANTTMRRVGAGMHATPTLDLVVVLEGSIDLVLEVERVKLKTGDAVIQRGTWHSWDNNSHQLCRLLVVNIARAQGA